MAVKLSIKKRSSTLLAVDLGYHSVKVMSFILSESGYSLATWAIKPLPASNIAELPSQERVTILSDCLQSLVSQLKIKGRACATSVSGPSVVVRFVKFPKMTEEELTQALRFEAEPYIPFNMDEVSLSHWTMGEVMEEGEPKIEVCLAAAKNDIVQERLEIIERAGLRAGVIDIDGIAVSNALEIARPDSKETVIVVNIGAEKTNIVILEGNRLFVIRDIASGGLAFTQAIQRELNMDYPSADKAKLEEGLNGKPEIAQALSGSARELGVEIRRSLDYYQAQREEGNINRLLLAGGGVLLKGLDHFLSERFGVDVELYNPLVNVDVSTVSPAPDGATATKLTVAAGLALRRLRE